MMSTRRQPDRYTAHLTTAPDGDYSRLRIYRDNIRIEEYAGSSIDGSDAELWANVDNLRARGVWISESTGHV